MQKTKIILKPLEISRPLIKQLKGLLKAIPKWPKLPKKKLSKTEKK